MQRQKSCWTADLLLGWAIKAEWRAAGPWGGASRALHHRAAAGSSGVEQGPFSRRWRLRRNTEPSGRAEPGQARCF